jgi:short-subunit dehydrogenase
MSKTAVITGATSGMGAEYARRLAAEHYDLIITGRRKEQIEKLAEDLRKQYGVGVNVVIAELSEDSDIKKLTDAVEATENIEILINNAGHSGYMKYFVDVESDHYERMIKVHQIVPMRLIKLVAPGMIKRGKGAIVNVSSIGAFSAMPEVHVYQATKAFLKMFSEGLYQELREKGIKVQALCPGFTDTNFAKDYLAEDEYLKYTNKIKMMMAKPEKVVDYSLKRLKGNKVVCIPGLLNKFMVTIFSLLPRGMYYSMAKKMTKL